MTLWWMRPVQRSGLFFEDPGEHLYPGIGQELHAPARDPLVGVLHGHYDPREPAATNAGAQGGVRP